MGSLCVAGCIEFECHVAFVHSCVHGQQWARELIGFTDNSRFLPRIQMRRHGSVFVLSFVAGLSYI